MPNRLKKARQNDSGSQCNFFEASQSSEMVKKVRWTISLLSVQEARTLLQEEEKLMDRVDTDVDYNMEGNSANF